MGAARDQNPPPERVNIHQRAREIMRDDPHQRLGQAYYNALRFEDRWLAENIDGTERDPFNNDANLPAFLEAWYAAWGGDGAGVLTESFDWPFPVGAPTTPPDDESLEAPA